MTKSIGTNGRGRDTRFATAAAVGTGHGKSVLTTGQIVALFHVSSRTATAWVDSGELKGYRLPSRNPKGNRDRRVHFADALAFAVRIGCEHVVARLRPVVLCCGAPDGVRAFLADSLPPAVAVRSCTTLFDVGLEVAAGAANLTVVLGPACFRSEALHAANRLRSMALVLALVRPDDDAPQEWGFTGAVPLTEPERWAQQALVRVVTQVSGMS